MKKECSKCCVSAMCLPVGSGAFMLNVWRCFGCQRVFFGFAKGEFEIKRPACAESIYSSAKCWDCIQGGGEERRK